MVAWFVFGFMCASAAVMAAAYFKFVSLRKAVQRAQLRLYVCLRSRRELLPSLAWSAAALPELKKDFAYALGQMKEKCAQADTMQKHIDCEAEVSRNLQKFFAGLAMHKELEKDEYFLKLQRSVLACESKIQRCKKRYNSAVRDFNTLTGLFPLSVLAKLLDFEKYEYFDFTASLDKILD